MGGVYFFNGTYAPISLKDVSTLVPVRHLNKWRETVRRFTNKIDSAICSKKRSSEKWQEARSPEKNVGDNSAGCGLPLDEGNYNCPGKEWIDLRTYGQADFLAMKLREHEEVETVGDIEFAEDGREVIS